MKKNEKGEKNVRKIKCQREREGGGGREKGREGDEQVGKISIMISSVADILDMKCNSWSTRQSSYAQVDIGL